MHFGTVAIQKERWLGRATSPEGLGQATNTGSGRSGYSPRGGVQTEKARVGLKPQGVGRATT